MSDITKKLLTVDEAALYIGYTKGSLYKMKSQGRVPAYKPTPGKLLFSREDLDGFLNRGRQKSNYELADEADQIISKRMGGRK